MPETYFPRQPGPFSGLLTTHGWNWFRKRIKTNERYKGKIDLFEVWNEPDGTTFWKQFGEGEVNAEAGFFKDGDEKQFTNGDFRFTYKDSYLYVFQMRPSKTVKIKTLKLHNPHDYLIESVELLGSDEKIDYIKYDVEGAEKEALEGSRRIIKKYRPDLLISIYHRTEDLHSLILQVHDLCPEYKLYIRRYPYIPAWDLNLYAVKK